SKNNRDALSQFPNRTMLIQGDYFSYCHEFAYFCLPPNHKEIEGRPIAEPDWDWDNLRKWGRESERETARNCFYPIFIKNGKIVSFGDVCSEDEHPSRANIQKQDGVIAVYPIDSSGVERKWRYERGTVEGIRNILRVHCTREGEYQIQKARTHDNIKTVWTDSRYIAGDYGTTILTNLGVKPHSNLYPKSIYTVLDSIQPVSSAKSIIVDYFAGSGTTGHAIINLNREDGGKRKYILVEMGEYFDTVLKPRIQKVVYSKDWKDGKPVSREGISHIFKYMKLESYEDTLDNLIIKRDKKQQKTLTASKTAKEEYMLGYMLDIETRGSDSLLNIDRFEDPFSYTLEIRHDNELKTTKVDLVETFNYLIGLYVEQTEVIRGFKVIRGRLRTGEKTLVIWRNTKEKSNKELDTFFLKQGYNTQDFEFDKIFVNGDNNLENLKVAEDKWKVSLIEEEFKKRMFDVKDV
ncbi:MAG TPA: DNA methyltransferase, partial [Candidatus Brocadia sapporoensis]|nr:DNA methyltransferase [Candidatus Brocadia sapporoensis]